MITKQSPLMVICTYKPKKTIWPRPVLLHIYICWEYNYRMLWKNIVHRRNTVCIRVICTNNFMVCGMDWIVTQRFETNRSGSKCIVQHLHAWQAVAVWTCTTVFDSLWPNEDLVVFNWNSVLFSSGSLLLLLLLLIHMTTAKSVEEKEFLRKFIAVYCDLPELRKVKSDE